MTKIQRRYEKELKKLKKHPNKPQNCAILWVLQYKYGDEFYRKELEQYFDEETIKIQINILTITVVFAALVGLQCYNASLNRFNGCEWIFAGILLYCTIYIIYALYQQLKYVNNIKLFQYIYETLKDDDETRKTYENTKKIKHPKKREIHKSHW